MYFLKSLKQPGAKTLPSLPGPWPGCSRGGLGAGGAMIGPGADLALTLQEADSNLPPREACTQGLPGAQQGPRPPQASCPALLLTHKSQACLQNSREEVLGAAPQPPSSLSPPGPGAVQEQRRGPPSLPS